MKDAFKLYVLDDDQQYAELLVEVASSQRWQAESFQDPVCFLSSQLPDSGILVLDLIMPEMDGIEVIRALAEKASQLSLILISGFDSRVLHSAQQLAEAHNIKVHASLSKPLSIGEFISVLENIETDTEFDSEIIVNQTPISITELQQALHQQQFVPYFQPLVDMKTRRLESIELLIRWNHPQRGMVFPDQFIPLAEKNDLINPLTNIVVRLAMEQAKAWESEGIDVPISINISSENIKSLNFPEQLTSLLEQHSLETNRISLEITESSVLGELTSSLDILNRLRLKGFSLSVDDFGTGYSSLSQLYQAPFSVLKIDRSFVMRMHKDNEAMAIVQICIMLGKMLAMTVVAEGVESKEIWDKLAELGCNIAQGYHIARPMPAEKMKHWKESFEKG